MRIIGAHPTGNANSRQAMIALAENNLLEIFFTSIAVFDGSPLSFLASFPGFSELLRRRFPIELKFITQTFPVREGVRLCAQKAGWNRLVEHEVGWASVDRVFRDLDQKVSKAIRRKKPGAVFCYEDSALESFRAAKSVGAKRILDYPVAHWRRVRRILLEERDLQPAWSDTMVGLFDSKEKLDRKDEELLLGDAVLVASTFSKESLLECPFPTPPAVVIPYGAPPTSQTAGKSMAATPSKRLRVLFVGALGQPKGVSYLFEALELLGDLCSLTLVGRATSKNCVPLNQALQKHRWIPSLPHAKVLEEMRDHDVFVFPSLSEGFGMVLTEAMSQGLPIITTPNTCGPDIITDGVEGFIVPIRSPLAIAEKLELLARNRELLREMGEAARKKSQNSSWEGYRKKVAETVLAVCSR